MLASRPTLGYVGRQDVVKLRSASYRFSDSLTVAPVIIKVYREVNAETRAARFTTVFAFLVADIIVMFRISASLWQIVSTL